MYSSRPRDTVKMARDFLERHSSNDMFQKFMSSSVTTTTNDPSVYISHKPLRRRNKNINKTTTTTRLPRVARTKVSRMSKSRERERKRLYNERKCLLKSIEKRIKTKVNGKNRDPIRARKTKLTAKDLTLSRNKVKSTTSKNVQQRSPNERNELIIETEIRDALEREDYILVMTLRQRQLNLRAQNCSNRRSERVSRTHRSRKLWKEEQKIIEERAKVLLRNRDVGRVVNWRRTDLIPIPRKAARVLKKACKNTLRVERLAAKVALEASCAARCVEVQVQRMLDIAYARRITLLACEEALHWKRIAHDSVLDAARERVLRVTKKVSTVSMDIVNDMSVLSAVIASQNASLFCSKLVCALEIDAVEWLNGGVSNNDDDDDDGDGEEEKEEKLGVSNDDNDSEDSPSEDYTRRATDYSGDGEEKEEEEEEHNEENYSDDSFDDYSDDSFDDDSDDDDEP